MSIEQVVYELKNFELLDFPPLPPPPKKKTTFKGERYSV
jgi:hypothetical protein